MVMTYGNAQSYLFSHIWIIMITVIAAWALSRQCLMKSANIAENWWEVGVHCLGFKLYYFYKQNQEINRYIVEDLLVIFFFTGAMAYKNILHVSQKQEIYRWKTFACLLEPESREYFEKIGHSCWKFLLH